MTEIPPETLQFFSDLYLIVVLVVLVALLHKLVLLFVLFAIHSLKSRNSPIPFRSLYPLNSLN